MNCATQDLKTSMELALDDAERTKFTDQCKGIRYRSLIGDPEKLKELRGEIDQSDVWKLTNSLGNKKTFGP